VDRGEQRATVEQDYGIGRVIPKNREHCPKFRHHTDARPFRNFTQSFSGSFTIYFEIKAGAVSDYGV